TEVGATRSLSNEIHKNFTLRATGGDGYTIQQGHPPGTDAKNIVNYGRDSQPEQTVHGFRHRVTPPNPLECRLTVRALPPSYPGLRTPAITSRHRHQPLQVHPTLEAIYERQETCSFAD